MAPLIRETRNKEGFEEFQQIKQIIKHEVWYAQKRKDDTQEHVKRYRAWKKIVVDAIQAEKVVALEVLSSVAPKNL
jgi:hypothetical protein